MSEHEVRNINDEVVATYDDGNPYLATLEETREIKCGALSVVVDWIELLDRMDEPQAFEMIGRLKDLLE